MSLRRKLFLLISAVILCAGFLLSSPSHNKSAESAGLPVGKSICVSVDRMETGKGNCSCFSRFESKRKELSLRMGWSCRG